MFFEARNCDIVELQRAYIALSVVEPCAQRIYP
jgi:hypothetical protein